ncbi:MAG: hypothetical protein ABJA70_05605, partial [Chryseolinea sp.]
RTRVFLIFNKSIAMNNRFNIDVVYLQDILDNVYRILSGLHWNQSLSPSLFCKPRPETKLIQHVPRFKNHF